MSDTSPFHLRIMDIPRGVDIRYQLPPRVAVVARYRVWILRAMVAGFVTGFFGALIFVGSMWLDPVDSQEQDDQATLFVFGLVLSVLGFASGLVICAFIWLGTSMPMLRRPSEISTSADVRIAIQHGWVRIWDYRLKDRLIIRFPRNEISGIEVVAGIGGTELGALVMYLKHSDPIELMLRVPLPELRTVAEKVADEIGMISPGLKDFIESEETDSLDCDAESGLEPWSE